MMRNKYQEMQDFILHLSDIYRENPDIEFSHEGLSAIIYSELVTLGVKDRDADFTHMGDRTFDRLSSYFTNRRNLNAYVDPRNGYFIQLQNKPELFENNIETISIYLPQDAKNIERSSRVLFDFLDDSNIPHRSKISRTERNDDILVQVTNMNDANKILNFAKGNRQIQAGLLPNNPFCYDTDGISIAYGRNGASFNSVLASLLAVYSMDRIKENKIDEMFLLDFIDFANKYYDHYFKDLNDLGEVVADFNLKGAEKNTNENNKRIVNVKNIYNYFLSSMYPMYNLEIFNKEFLDTSNDGKLIAEANEINKKRYDKPTPIEAQFVGSIDGLLLESVDTFKDKYHITEDSALNIVRNYLSEGNPSKITRDNDIRTKYIKNDFSNKMKKLLEISKKDLDSYYQDKKRIRTINSLQDAIMETYQKYEDRYEQGFEQADGISIATFALKNLLVTGNAGSFTRNNNARANLIKFGDNSIILNELGNGNPEIVKEEKALTNACREYVMSTINSRLENNQMIEHTNSI